MKRLFVVVAAFLILAMPISAYAAYNPLGDACNTQDANAAAACSAANPGSDPISGSGGILRKASLILATLGALIAVIMIIVSGFRYVASAGDMNKAAQARNTIIGSLVGLVIIAAAETIVIFIVSRVK